MSDDNIRSRVRRESAVKAMNRIAQSSRTYTVRGKEYFKAVDSDPDADSDRDDVQYSQRLYGWVYKHTLKCDNEVLSRSHHHYLTTHHYHHHLIIIQTATIFNAGYAVSINYNTVGDNNYLGTTNNGAYDYNYIGDLKNIAFYNYALTASEATVYYITE